MNFLEKTILLKNHSGFRKYFKNTSWLIAERILRLIITLFVGIYVARYLGPDLFGLLSYTNSFVGIFLAIATLGIESILIRELVKRPHHTNELLGTAFGLKIIGTIIMWVFILIAVYISNNDNHTNEFISIISLAIIFQAYNVIDFKFQAEVKAKSVAQIKLVQILFTSATKLYLIIIKAPLLWFVWVYFFDALVLASGLIIMYIIKSGKVLLWRWNWNVASDLLRDSWPLILSGMLISIYVKIDQIMIKELIGDREVGIYAVATSLSTATYFIPIVITDSLFPAIINAKNNNTDLYHKRLQKLYDTLIWIGIIISIIVFFVSDYIIYYCFGNEYIQSSSVLKIAIFTGIFVNIGLVNNKYFTAENRQKDILYRSILGVFINITLNLLLIKEYGANGAALTTIIASFSASILYTSLKKDARILFFMTTNSLDIRRFKKLLLSKY